MNIDAYLKRIDYRGSLEPDLQTLRALHVAHMYTVPFENLDVVLRQPTVLDIDRIYDKVVHQRRGGICCELNALFGALLSALGFEITMLAAWSCDGRAPREVELIHMLLAVNLGRRWLADVGFGDSFREPLLLDEAGLQTDGERMLRVAGTGDRRLLWARRPRKQWERLYRFTLHPREVKYFAANCHYGLTTPRSFFARNTICSLPTPDGRVTLMNDELITTANTRRKVHRVRSPQEYRATMRRLFGIELPERCALDFLLRRPPWMR